LKKIITDQNYRVGEWVSERTNSTFNVNSISCIGLEENGELIAGVIYDGYNTASIAMHVAVEGMINREFLWFCFYYPFEQLNVHKIIGMVEETNSNARKLDEHLGFELETRIKNACINGDLLIYSMTKDQCRHLRIKHGTK